MFWPRIQGTVFSGEANRVAIEIRDPPLNHQLCRRRPPAHMAHPSSSPHPAGQADRRPVSGREGHRDQPGMTFGDRDQAPTPGTAWSVAGSLPHPARLSDPLQQVRQRPSLWRAQRSEHAVAGGRTGQGHDFLQLPAAFGESDEY